MFIVFALVTLLGAGAMILQKNVITAGLCMVLTFFGVAGLFLLLANPVAAALQLIVYSGAIMVLEVLTIGQEDAKMKETRPIPTGMYVYLDVPTSPEYAAETAAWLSAMTFVAPPVKDRL